MVNPASESGIAIEKLLQERSQYEQWLARLAGAGTAAPDTVRQRVRADYEARLEGVIDELRTHASTIDSDLERVRESQRDLERRESDAEERMAEAEVRHAVGEFEESRWQQIRDDSSGTLTGIRDELASVRSEIVRLAEVQRLIAAPAQTATPVAESQPAEAGSAPSMVTAAAGESSSAAHSPTPPAASPAASPTASAPASAAADMDEFEPIILEAAPAPPPAPESLPAAPRFVPRAPSASPAAAPPGDELAFLKSVTGDSSGRARTPNSNGTPAATGTPEGATAKATAPNQAKTLKCAECATLNRPTEWYCERCGAELAAL